MRRIGFLFSVFVVSFLAWGYCYAGDFLTLDLVGSRFDDSIQVHLTVMDTTFYPTITDAQDLYVLRFKPNGDLLDSTRIGSSNMFKTRTGWYQAHYRASSPDSVLGIYTVYAAVRVGGAWRGHVAASYLVLDQRAENYLADIESLMVMADSGLVTSEQISLFLGACDGCVRAYIPNDGTANKDGYETYLSGVKRVTVYFGHSNVENVLDSTATTRED